jgi:hypothetical protein
MVAGVLSGNLLYHNDEHNVSSYSNCKEVNTMW